MLPKNITLDTTLVDKHSLVGTTHGNLTCEQVVGFVPDGRARRLCYSFSCSCGNKVLKRGRDVLSKKTLSCGCLLKESTRNTGASNKRPPTDGPARERYYKQYVSTAKRRGLEFSITEEEFFTLTSSNCYYCNCQPNKEFGRNWKGFSLPYICHGIDRKENSVGYITENSVACCSMCNYMKKDFPEEIFINKAKSIANNH